MASAEHRLQMLQIAIKGLPHCSITNIELQPHASPFTYDTLCQLRTQYENSDKDVQWHLVIGDDLLYTLPKWHCAEQLLEEFGLYIGQRGGKIQDWEALFKDNPKVLTQICSSILPMRQLEISATELRSRLAQQLYCDHLMPPQVINYIQTHHLYGT